MRLSEFVDAIAHPKIRDETELRRYVIKVCAAAIAIAFCADFVNHLVFWGGVGEAVRSWAITVVIAAAIAFPVATAIARAHLDLTRTKDEFELLSRTDPLTGLLNRRALFAAPSTGAVRFVALVIADIDRFKRVNDTYGHLIGDRVIREIADILVDELGDLGEVGRVGGEEFALITYRNEEGLLRLRLEQARLRISLADIATREEGAIHVTISIGAAHARAGQDFDAIYAEADDALYAAKAAGGNRVVHAGEANATTEPKAASVGV